MKIQFEEKIWELPEIVDYENYSYNKSCQCDNCSFGNWVSNYRKGIVGYCQTGNGIFLCFVCPQCGSKYRYHFSLAGERGNMNEWKEDVGLAMYLEGYPQFLVKG